MRGRTDVATASEARCLQVGCYEDVIAVREDPLAQVEALERVGFAMSGGVVYKARGRAVGAAGVRA